MTEDQFLLLIAKYLRMVDPGMHVVCSNEMAESIFYNWKARTKVKFGDPEYAWDETAAAIFAGGRAQLLN